MSPLATWVLLSAAIAVAWTLVGLWARWQRRHPSEVESQWVEDWWWQYRHHFEDDEGEAADGSDAA